MFSTNCKRGSSLKNQEFAGILRLRTEWIAVIAIASGVKDVKNEAWSTSAVDRPDPVCPSLGLVLGVCAAGTATAKAAETAKGKP
jgi:hypothetical protein